MYRTDGDLMRTTKGSSKERWSINSTEYGYSTKLEDGRRRRGVTRGIVVNKNNKKSPMVNTVPYSEL